MPLKLIYCSGIPRYAVSHSSVDNSSEETEPGEPMALRPAGTIRTSQSPWLPAVTALSLRPRCPQAHRPTPSCISHVLSSRTCSPNIQHSRPCCPSPRPPPFAFQARKAMVSPAESHSTGEKKLKESPFKSSSCPASRKVSLPSPQIKDTDVKLMPHLISAKKPRGFKTFIHLKL